MNIIDTFDHSTNKFDFTVSIYKKNKESGKRRMNYLGFSSFENLLFDGGILNEICNKVYYVDYWYEMLGEDLFIHRTKAVGLLCEYEIKLFDHHNSQNLLAHYIVEMECHNSNYSAELFKSDLQPSEKTKQIEDKKHSFFSNWFLKLPFTSKIFLLSLKKYGNLKEVKTKSKIPKSSFYRVKKNLEENGIINGDKILKRIVVKNN